MSKSLKQILQGLDYRILSGSPNTEINQIVFDSRRVEPGALFVALKGTKVDGHKFIPQAVEKGASAILCQQCQKLEKVTVIQVDNTHIALARIAANFFDNPSQQITLVGVTGTNGKTTIATTLFNLFESMGYYSALLSTIRYLVHNLEIPATHTTPDPVTINYVLSKALNKGCKYAFMEVSSHALDQHRTDFLHFNGAIFTNITHDHLDYHGSFKNYIAAKKKLFDQLPSNAFALVNADDKHWSVMVQNTKAKVYTYGLKNLADFKAKILEKHFDGTLITIDGTEVWINLLGQFNVQNILAVYATARLLGFDKQTVLTHLSKMQPVEGRFQVIKAHDVTAIVDYAHSPDALAKILDEINSIRSYGQRIITVFGAGGDRDKDKRPKMGAIASTKSDVVILTSDNPRSEDPMQIIEQIRSGIKPEYQHKVLVNADRREAIRTALSLAQKGDIVLVAGKGHETYQEINGLKYHFDDRQVIRQFFGIEPM